MIYKAPTSIKNLIWLRLQRQ